MEAHCAQRARVDARRAMATFPGMDEAPSASEPRPGVTAPEIPARPGAAPETPGRPDLRTPEMPEPPRGAEPEAPADAPSRPEAPRSPNAPGR
jgi:hypothetical protein